MSKSKFIHIKGDEPSEFSLEAGQYLPTDAGIIKHSDTAHGAYLLPDTAVDPMARFNNQPIDLTKEYPLEPGDVIQTSDTSGYYYKGVEE
jgi:hypothetical protein